MHLTPEQTIAPEPTSAVREAWEEDYRKQNVLDDEESYKEARDAYQAEMTRIDAIVSANAAKGHTPLMQSALASSMKADYCYEAIRSICEKESAYRAKLEDAWRKFKREEWPVMWANAVREFHNNPTNGACQS